MKKLSVSWSGGKDSAFMLHKLIHQKRFEIVELHTTFNAENRRVGMHGIREELIERQTDSLGFPLKKLYTPSSSDHRAYEDVMEEYFQDLKSRHIEAIAFGDIFLEDLKRYRVSLISKFEIEPVFPIWGYDTTALVKEFISLGFKAKVCAADDHFSKTEVGRELGDLDVFAKGIDPCGENGEYHSFVWDGPIFKFPIPTKLGDTVQKEYRYSSEENGKLVEHTKKFWFKELSLS